jgi:hypothetical protein
VQPGAQGCGVGQVRIRQAKVRPAALLHIEHGTDVVVGAVGGKIVTKWAGNELAVGGVLEEPEDQIAVMVIGTEDSEILLAQLLVSRGEEGGGREGKLVIEVLVHCGGHDALEALALAQHHELATSVEVHVSLHRHDGAGEGGALVGRKELEVVDRRGAFVVRPEDGVTLEDDGVLAAHQAHNLPRGLAQALVVALGSDIRIEVRCIVYGRPPDTISTGLGLASGVA